MCKYIKIYGVHYITISLTIVRLGYLVADCNHLFVCIDKTIV